MKKILQARITLLSPTCKTTCPVQIIYDDGENPANPAIEIHLICHNSWYQGYGTDHLWVDAFADLQNKLPGNMKLACCMTCRHGNMCPYGNAENQLFCTKGLQIANKEDLCNLFDKSELLQERSVASLDFCDDFACQSDNFYTYNDFLYWQQKKTFEKESGLWYTNKQRVAEKV